MMDFTELVGKKVIVRGNMPGCFYGTLKQVSNTTLDGSKGLLCVQLENSRRLWYWDGANSLSDLAVNGTAKPKDCKFPAPIKSHFVHDICEIISTTDKAQKSIEAVPEWKYGSN